MGHVGSCLSLRWTSWRDFGVDSWVVEVLREGYRIPFLGKPPLSKEPIRFDSYSPSSVKGKALEKEISAMVDKGAVELASSFSGVLQLHVCGNQSDGRLASNN